MNFQQIKRIYQTEGIGGLAFEIFYDTCANLANFKILIGMTLQLQDVDEKFLEPVEGFEGGFLSREQVEKFSNSAEYDLPANFVSYALSRADECYGFLNDGRLAAYGWYARNTTRLSNTLNLHFSKDYVYMYRGYTHRDFRGKRLHAMGMAQAAKAYHSRGYKGLISYVEANNFASLRSVYRMGYRNFGRVVIFQMFGKCFIFHSAGCRDYGFRVIEAHKEPRTQFPTVVAKP